MSKKTVCDRCGDEIKKKPSFMNMQFPAVVAGVAVKESLLCDFYEFDLCDDCKVALVEWIRKGKEKDDGTDTQE